MSGTVLSTIPPMIKDELDVIITPKRLNVDHETNALKTRQLPTAVLSPVILMLPLKQKPNKKPLNAYRCRKSTRFTKRKRSNIQPALKWRLVHPAIGERVAKSFKVGSRHKVFTGVVTKVLLPSRSHKHDQLFRVVYDDFDEEDFDDDELDYHKYEYKTFISM
jgi:hypothetical protein